MCYSARVEEQSSSKHCNLLYSITPAEQGAAERNGAREFNLRQYVDGFRSMELVGEANLMPDRDDIHSTLRMDQPPSQDIKDCADDDDK